MIKDNMISRQEIFIMVNFMMSVILIFFIGLMQFDKDAELRVNLYEDQLFKDYQDRIDSYKIREHIDLDSAGFGTEGYWFSDDYYIFRIANRTQEEWQGIKCHEACHQLVWEDKKHFCRV
jgi:hypothetical protein